MWGNDFQPAARLGDSMQFRDEPEYIRNMLDDVAANDLFKFVVVERIREGAEIVNDVCVAARVCIDADRAGKFVLSTADVKNPHFLLLTSDDTDEIRIFDPCHPRFMHQFCSKAV